MDKAPCSAGAPLLYVAQQMGHSSPTTTLRFYAQWVPSGDSRWVEVLSQPPETAAPATLEPEAGTKTGSGTPGEPGSARSMSGEPWWSRTTNLLIKSQLLCQLS